MSLPKDVEQTVATLLERAREVDDLPLAIAYTQQALRVARDGEVRVRRRFLTGGGLSGHYGRMDGSRVALTTFLVAGVVTVVIWSLITKDAGSVGQYTSPVSALAGICLGWLFTKDDGQSVRAAAREEADRREAAEAEPGLLSTSVDSSSAAPEDRRG